VKTLLGTSSTGANSMSRERKSNREAKKKPVLTMKQKRSAKKARVGESGFSINPPTTRRPTA